MARPPKYGRDARTELRSKPAHKAIWESLLNEEDGESLTDWLNDAANERAMRIMEKRQPGSWNARAHIRRPSGPVAKPVVPPPDTVAPPARKKRSRPGR